MASEAGLIQRWNSKKLVHQTDQKEENAKHYVIQLELYYGVMIVWGSMWLFVLSIFCAEHIVHRRIRDSNPTRFWIIFEMIIDADRHFLVRDVNIFND